MTIEELAQAFVELYQDVDGVSDELTEREFRTTQKHWATYIAALEVLGR